MKHGGSLRLASLLLGCTSFLSAIPVVRAAEPERYEVDARVDRATGLVTADVVIRVRVAEGEASIALWLYADRLAVAPSPMEERSWRWIYPGEIDLGGITIDALSVDGSLVEGTTAPLSGAHRARDFAGSDLVVPVAPGLARTVEVRFAMRLDVPDRFGRLGRGAGVLSLAAPWYPLVVDDGDAWAFDVPHALHVEVPGGEIATPSARGSVIDV